MVENEKDSNYELFSLMPALYYRLSFFIPASLSLSLCIYLYMYVLFLYIYLYVCMQAFQWIFCALAINHSCKEVFFNPGWAVKFF